MQTPAIQNDLIYDVGLHNGVDTAYYLHKRFRVVAIDANPMLTAEAETRFAKEIASGRLKVLNIGIAAGEETLSFWVNDTNDTQSSFDKARASRYGPIHEVTVRCLPLSSVIEEHGAPYYLKTDIEGNDYLCVRSLRPEKLPKYISVEFDYNHDLIAELHSLGYRSFKIINQVSFTDSTPIFHNETGLRLLRKISAKVPFVSSVVRSPTVSARLKKVDFDNFLERFDYPFVEGSSGPFGEETWGPWHSFDEIRRRVAAIERELTKGRVAPGTFWMDIHARC